MDTALSVGWKRAFPNPMLSAKQESHLTELNAESQYPRYFPGQVWLMPPTQVYSTIITMASARGGKFAKVTIVVQSWPGTLLSDKQRKLAR